MRIRIPLIVEESLINEIDLIAGEKQRRAATIETALREFIARQGRKAKKSQEPEKAKKVTPSKPAAAAKIGARAKR